MIPSISEPNNWYSAIGRRAMTMLKLQSPVPDRVHMFNNDILFQPRMKPERALKTRNNRGAFNGIDIRLAACTFHLDRKQRKHYGDWIEHRHNYTLYLLYML